MQSNKSREWASRRAVRDEKYGELASGRSTGNRRWRRRSKGREHVIRRDADEEVIDVKQSFPYFSTLGESKFKLCKTKGEARELHVQNTQVIIMYMN